MDGLGNPVEFMLSAGNDHDSVHAVALLENVDISNNILADHAYGAKTIRVYISEQAASYVLLLRTKIGKRRMKGETGNSRGMML